LINIKVPGTNSTPQADSGITAQTLSFDPVEITISGEDDDNDPLAYRISEPPENGSFVAPLYPYFIQDYRLNPTGDINRCTEGRPESMVVEPQYVVVTDEGVSYVLNAGLNPPDDCSLDDPFFFLDEYRISVFDADGNFILGRDLPRSQDLFGLYIDEEAGFITYLSFEIGEIVTPVISKLNLDTLETMETYRFGVGTGGIFKAVIDRNNVMYTSTGRGFVNAFDLNEATTENGRDFILGDVVKQLRTFIDPNDPDDLFNADPALDMAINARGQLHISTFYQVYQYTPSVRDLDGRLTVGSQIGFMGACSSGEGCDPERQATRGFSCTHFTCNALLGPGFSGPGQFDLLGGIAIDPNNNIYVADSFNFRVQRFTPEGIYAGQAQSNCPDENRCFVLGDFGQPSAVSVNSDNFYVIDDEFDILHIFETSVIDPQDDGTAKVTYRSADGFIGTDRFSFAATDGLATSQPAEVEVDVDRNFRAPVVEAVSMITASEDTQIVARLLASDPDGALDNLSYRVLEAPSVGTISGTAPDIVYQPPEDFL